MGGGEETHTRWLICFINMPNITMTSELLHPVWARYSGGSGSEHPLNWHTVCLYVYLYMYVCVCVCTSSFVDCFDRCPCCLPVHVLLKIQMFYVSYIKVHLFYTTCCQRRIRHNNNNNNNNHYNNNYNDKYNYKYNYNKLGPNCHAFHSGKKYANAAKVEATFFQENTPLLPN